MASHKVFVQGHSDYRVGLNRTVSGTVHVRKPKEHAVQLNGNGDDLRLQLENNLTDIKTYVTGLFQKDRFTAADALAIQAALDYILTQKTIASAAGLGIAAEFGSLATQISERLHSVLRIQGEADLIPSKLFAGYSPLTILSDVRPDVLGYYKGTTGFSITQDTVDFSAQKSIRGTGSIGLASSVSDITSIIESTFFALLGLDASADLAKSVGYDSAASLALQSDIDGAIESLIGGDDKLGVTFAVDLGNINKGFDADSRLGLLSFLDELLQTLYFSAASRLGIDSAAQFMKAITLPDVEADIGLTSVIDAQVAKCVDATDILGITSLMDSTGVYDLIETPSEFTISAELLQLINEALIAADESLAINSNVNLFAGKDFDAGATLALQATITVVIQNCIDAIGEISMDSSMDSAVRSLLYAAAGMSMDARVSGFVSSAEIQARSEMNIDGSISLGYMLAYHGQSAFAVDGAVDIATGKPIVGAHELGIDFGAGNLLASKDYAGEDSVGILADALELIDRILADTDESKLGITESADFAQGDIFDGEDRLGITSEIVGALKSYLTARSALGVDAAFESIEHSPVLKRFYDGAAKLGIQAGAEANVIEQFIADATAVSVLAECAFEYFQNVAAEAGLGFNATVEFSQYRLRKVNEMDNLTLSAFDDMSLFDLDYILVE